jgi:hypothetical protein
MLVNYLHLSLLKNNDVYYVPMLLLVGGLVCKSARTRLADGVRRLNRVKPARLKHYPRVLRHLHRNGYIFYIIRYVDYAPKMYTTVDLKKRRKNIWKTTIHNLKTTRLVSPGASRPRQVEETGVRRTCALGSPDMRTRLAGFSPIYKRVHLVICTCVYCMQM